MKKKKNSDYNLHAAIIALSVGGGILLAACSPMMSSQDMPAPTPSPEASPIVTVPPESLQGQVQGVTTETLEQQLDEIDQAMYRLPEEELGE